MKERELVVVLRVKTSAPIWRVREKVLCNLARRLDTPAVYEVKALKVHRPIG